MKRFVEIVGNLLGDLLVIILILVVAGLLLLGAVSDIAEFFGW